VSIVSASKLAVWLMGKNKALILAALNHVNLLELMRLIELVELKIKVTDANLDFIPELRLRLAQAIK